MVDGAACPGQDDARKPSASWQLGAPLKAVVVFLATLFRIGNSKGDCRAKLALEVVVLAAEVAIESSLGVLTMRHRLLRRLAGQRWLHHLYLPSCSVSAGVHCQGGVRPLRVEVRPAYPVLVG